MESQTSIRPDARDVPYLMKLSDGRRVFVEIPGKFVVSDRSGEMAFTADGVRFLDRVRALAGGVGGSLTPGQIASLRQALGLTQKQLGELISVNKLTVSRWERGTLRPGNDSRARLEKVWREAISKGVLVSA